MTSFIFQKALMYHHPGSSLGCAFWNASQHSLPSCSPRCSTVKTTDWPLLSRFWKWTRYFILCPPDDSKRESSVLVLPDLRPVVSRQLTRRKLRALGTREYRHTDV